MQIHPSPNALTAERNYIFMTKHNVPCLNNIHYCKFPQGINTVSEFITYLNTHYPSFLELEFYIEQNCVAPYFISDATEIQYINTEHIRLVKEEEIFILSQKEYDEKLKKVISEKCIHCAHYNEDICEQDFTSHSEHINLDGDCYAFEKK